MKTIARYGLLCLLLITAASFASKIKPKAEGTAQIKVVCIDAGHGGKDPGCHGDKQNEKDVCLAIALKLGDYIEKNIPNVKVVYTRKTDVFVELNERAAIANRNNADLFICIHCNSACVRNKQTKKDVCNEEAHGAETYIMGLHKTTGNLDVAKRENSAIEMETDYKTTYDGFDPNSDEAYIIMRMVQSANMEQSTDFARRLQEEFSGKAARKDKGVSQAGFLVLWKTSMPSVLIETGFLTNPQEEKFLGSSKGQEVMAACIFRAFRHWKDNMEGNDSLTYNDDMENMTSYKLSKDDSADVRKPVNGIRGQQNNGQKTDSTVTVVPKKNDQPRDTVKNNPVVTGETYYSVQILSSDKELAKDDARIRDMADVSMYTMNGSYKYVAGHYSTMSEAVKRQKELADKFKGCFVVTFKDGKRVK